MQNGESLWRRFRFGGLVLLLGFLPLAGSLQAAGQRGFRGGDLAVVNEPYTLFLPVNTECEVAWGDGAVEQFPAEISKQPEVWTGVEHVYAKVGVASIIVKKLEKDRPAVPLAQEFIERFNAESPTFFFPDHVDTAYTYHNDLAKTVDSFSVECRVRLDDPTANQVIFASTSNVTAGCRLGIKNQLLFFEKNGAGECAVPVGNRLVAGQWHHVAATYDRVPLFPRSNQVCFYIDGRPAGIGVIPAADSGPLRCDTFQAGIDGFKGKIESMAVYDRLLFPLAIWEHANALAGDKTFLVTIAHRGSSEVKVDLPAITRTIDVPLNPDPQSDNGPALRKAIEAAGNGTKLRLVNAADPGHGGTFSVRSLIEGNKWAAMDVENKTDFELDGNGSTLIFSDKVARYLLVDHDQRVAVRNLSFDLDPAYARVGLYAKLMDVDPESQTFKAQLINARDGKPDPLIPKRASYWRWRPHDPVSLRIGHGGPYFDSSSYAEKPVADPASGPGVIRFKLKEEAKNKLWKKLKEYAAGDNFYLINNAEFNSNAVSLQNSSQITFDSVNYYGTLGMVFLSASLDHLHITHCKIGLPPGQTAADRPLSSGADGYHFHLTRGQILFDHNEIALTDDDPISIKDDIYPNVKKLGDNQLQAGKGIKEGSPVELLNPDYSFTGFTAQVTAADKDILTLDKPLPAEVKKGSLLMNRSHHTMNWILRDNYLHDYYGRVMLYTDYGTVTNNRVHRSLYHLGNSIAYFETAGASRNVITHRNLFEATSADAAIWGGNPSLPAFHEITYSANSFLGKGLDFNNAVDSLVVRNWFNGTDAALSVNRCVNIQVRDNLGFQPGARPLVKVSRNNMETVIENNVKY